MSIDGCKLAPSGGQNTRLANLWTWRARRYFLWGADGRLRWSDGYEPIKIWCLWKLQWWFDMVDLPKMVIWASKRGIEANEQAWKWGVQLCGLEFQTYLGTLKVFTMKPPEWRLKPQDSGWHCIGQGGHTSIIIYYHVLDLLNPWPYGFVITFSYWSSSL